MLATICRSASSVCGTTSRAKNASNFHELWRRTSPLPKATRAFQSHSNCSKHVISRSFASGGFLAVGLSPSSPAAETIACSCVNKVEKATSAGSRTLDRRKVTYQFRAARRRAFHSSYRWANGGKDRRSPKRREKDSEKAKDGGATATGSMASNATQKAAKGLAAASAMNKHVMDRLPTMSHLHRPNKEELLAAATGFWSRLKVRFKWFSIRSVRPFNMDEIGAFFSWFVLGHVIWILVGTTTFFSLAIFAVNTVFAQGLTPGCPFCVVRG